MMGCTLPFNVIGRGWERLGSFTTALALLLCLLMSQPAVAIDLPLTAGQGGGFYLAEPSAPSVPAYLLDTGSKYVSLTQERFDQLNRATEIRFLRTITGVMANGDKARVPIYRLAELVLSRDCVLKDIEVAVLQGSDRNILGMNALMRMQPFTIALQPAMLSSATCS